LRHLLPIIWLVTTLSPWCPTHAGETVPGAQPGADAAIIGEVILRRSNIFDLSDPDEDKSLYRLANRLHVVTREPVLAEQLLFRPGDVYSQRVIEESERILRSRKYLYDADIRPLRTQDGVVDVEVTTRDIWSLLPELSYSRSGGEDKWVIGMEESNLLGRGQLLGVAYADDVDRTSRSIQFADHHIGQSWVSLAALYSDNSDGESRAVSIVRPFYALDSTWAAGGSLTGDDRRSTLYSGGDEAAEYRHERDYASLWRGWSRGMKNHLARRWTAGWVFDDNDFSEVPDPTLPAVLPDDRKLVYPFVGFELVEDEYVTSSNHDQISRTEDFLMGRRVTASLGWSDESLGASHDALIVAASASRGLGDIEATALLLALDASSRFESGHSQNAQLTASARFYHRQSGRRLFFASLHGTAGHALDVDNPVIVGGKTGLRGYPLNYQSGDSSVVMTVEQRFFTDWYPFRLVHVGAAVFADVGRAWGVNPADVEERAWLSDIGFGLRFAPTRFTHRKMFHLDFAFPLNGDDSIDSMQISFRAKRSF
jgi:outer membrane protein assembly factor BamA